MEISKTSRIYCSIDLSATGKQFGELQVRHSDNRQSLGYYPVPIVSIVNGTGPTAVLTSGVHGDEFDGPVAIMRLAHSLTTQDINGRVILLPALNMPAVEASSRVSPLDEANLNRCFPGNSNGGPTEQLAYYLEEVLMPQSDLLVDIHGGGKASVFSPSALPNKSADPVMFQSNLTLARLFGAPLVWLLNSHNDKRSVNAAAERKRVPMIAAELGGGGNCDPRMVDMAIDGIRRCLQHSGVMSGEPDEQPIPRIAEITSSAQNLYAPFRGLFDRRFAAGDEATEGQPAGTFISLEEPQRTPVVLKFSTSGIVLAHTNRGYVEKGDMLGMIATDVTLPPGVEL